LYCLQKLHKPKQIKHQTKRQTQIAAPLLAKQRTTHNSQYIYFHFYTQHAHRAPHSAKRKKHPERLVKKNYYHYPKINVYFFVINFKFILLLTFKNEKMQHQTLLKFDQTVLAKKFEVYCISIIILKVRSFYIFYHLSMTLNQNLK
jgi:hypothetical protein